MTEAAAYVLKLKVSRRKARKELKNAILKGKSVLMLYRNYNESVSNRKILIVSMQTYFSQIPNEHQIFVHITTDEIRYKWWYFKKYWSEALFEDILSVDRTCHDTLSLSDDIKSQILRNISENKCPILSEKVYRQWRMSLEVVLGIIGNSVWINKFNSRYIPNIMDSDEPLFHSFESQLSFLEENLNQIKNIPKETSLLRLIKWFFAYVIKVAVERTVDNTMGSAK